MIVYKSRINSFNEIEFHDFEPSYLESIRKEIDFASKEYILSIDENEYTNYLITKYFLDPLTIHQETESIDLPRKKKVIVTDKHFLRTYEQEVYEFKVKYSFSGSPILFHVRPNPWTIKTYEINIDENLNIVSFEFIVYNTDREEFERTKKESYSSAFANLVNINANITGINNQIRPLVLEYFSKKKQSFIDENNFFIAINANINPNTKTIFSAPTIKKKDIPRPEKQKSIEVSNEPIMSQEMYLDVIKVMFEAGKSMERKPTLFLDKDELALRDQFLFILETRYEGISATGETFNKFGKTDILLKYAADGSNLFVGECKFWHGASELHKAINQLFDLYLTWRDSKAAIILFVTNKDFTKTLQIVESELKKHEYFQEFKGKKGDSSFSFLFRMPHDAKKIVYLEVMLFNFYNDRTK